MKSIMIKDVEKKTLLTCDNRSCYPCLCHLIPVNMHDTCVSQKDIM